MEFERGDRVRIVKDSSSSVKGTRQAVGREGEIESAHKNFYGILGYWVKVDGIDIWWFDAECLEPVRLRPVRLSTGQKARIIGVSSFGGHGLYDINDIGMVLEVDPKDETCLLELHSRQVWFKWSEIEPADNDKTSVITNAIGALKPLAHDDPRVAAALALLQNALKGGLS
jgi:hypothetical protein